MLLELSPPAIPARLPGHKLPGAAAAPSTDQMSAQDAAESADSLIPSEAAPWREDPDGISKGAGAGRLLWDDPPPADGASKQVSETERRFQWEPAFKQSLFFLAIMQGFRMATEPGSRAELRGPFFKDYFASVKNLRGWGDGDPFIVNYIGHPLQGAVSGFIQIQNDPKGVGQEVSNTKEYWKSRLKAMGWATLISTQFELGLLSEASLGNVGLRPTEKSNHPMGYVDLVVTPTLGTAWLVGEDALDRYLVRKIEDKTSNRVLRALTRSFLNPGRSFANLLRLKPAWYRDGRSL
jgi:hypothetical protein